MMNILRLIKEEALDNLRLGITFIPSQLIQVSIGFVSIMMIARLSHAALAASALMSVLWSALAVFFVSSFNAISIYVSHQRGAKDHKKISYFMNLVWCITLLMSAILILLLWALPYLFLYIHQPPQVIQLAKIYVHALMWEAPVLMYILTLEHFLSGLGKVRVILVINMIGVPLQIIATYLLMFGVWGLPKIGIAAIAWGYASTYFLIGLVVTGYLYLSETYKTYTIFRYPSPWNPVHLNIFLRLGVPLGFSQFVELGAFLVLTLLMAELNATVLAAHQFALQFFSLLIVPAFALSRVMTMRIGYLAGSQNYDKFVAAAIAGLLIALVLNSCILLGFDKYQLPLLALDIQVNNSMNAVLVKQTLELFSIVSICVLIGAFRNAARGVLRGLKDSHFLLVVSIISMWIVGLPVAYFLGFTMHLGGAGIWYGLAVGSATSTLMMLVRMYLLLRHQYLPQLIEKLK